MNASLSSIRAGLRPVFQQDLRGVLYFQFRNGQVRRQIGEGHSRVERRARRLAKRERVRRTKLGNPFLNDPDIVAAAVALERFRRGCQLAADRAAIAAL